MQPKTKKFLYAIFERDRLFAIECVPVWSIKLCVLQFRIYAKEGQQQKSTVKSIKPTKNATELKLYFSFVFFHRQRLKSSIKLLWEMRNYLAHESINSIQNSFDWVNNSFSCNFRSIARSGFSSNAKIRFFVWNERYGFFCNFSKSFQAEMQAIGKLKINFNFFGICSYCCTKLCANNKGSTVFCWNFHDTKLMSKVSSYWDQ